MDTTIAQSILAQLGGRRFLAMTGAHSVLAHDDGLSFKLPSTAHWVKNGINYCRITLTTSDTYPVEFGRVRHVMWTVLRTCEDIYADTLQACFTRETGLATHL